MLHQLPVSGDTVGPVQQQPAVIFLTVGQHGSPLPSFKGEPRCVAFGNESAEELASKVWTAINADNKVSLFVRTIDIASGETDTAIINKHQ